MTTSQKKRRWQAKSPLLKKYNIELPDGFRIVAEYVWQRGKMPKFALILIRENEQSGEYDMICRYDTAHDFAHLDLLDSKGRVIEKVAVSGMMSYKAAYTHAKNDLQTNYLRYWQAYLGAPLEESP
jgi:hypothetical protein